MRKKELAELNSQSFTLTLHSPVIAATVFCSTTKISIRVKCTRQAHIGGIRLMRHESLMIVTERLHPYLYYFLSPGVIGLNSAHLGMPGKDLDRKVIYIYKGAH